MTCRFAGAAICFAGLISLTVPATAAPIATCNASLTVCGIAENTLLQLPFAAIAGDVVLTEPNSTIVSDVFRIFNNIVNTAAGTGLGNMVFLYSADDGPLPASSTYSANVVFITEDPSGFTSYVGNGTDYILGAPEPQTFELFSLAVGAIVIVFRRRKVRFQGGL